MELPETLLSQSITEGALYFFYANCPIGIKEHIHVCIKRNNKLLFFSTCSSQINTALRLAELNGFDTSTYPVFLADNKNEFKKPQTYIDCNNVIEIDDIDFAKLLKSGKVKLLSGFIDEYGLKIIANGIRKSTLVSEEIKELFVKE